MVCVGLIAGVFGVWAIVASAENDAPHGFFMPFIVGLITGAPLAVVGLLGIAGLIVFAVVVLPKRLSR